MVSFVSWFWLACQVDTHCKFVSESKIEAIILQLLMLASFAYLLYESDLAFCAIAQLESVLGVYVTLVLG